jgi:LysM repeat protein
LILYELCLPFSPSLVDFPSPPQGGDFVMGEHSLVKPSRRWLRLIGVCVLCVMTACARPTPTVEQVEATATASLAATSDLNPSPAYSGSYTGTPTPNPTPVGRLNGAGVESYVVQPGETLGLIAAVFGCTVEEITAANGLADANAISAGQTLYIPIAATETGPDLKLIPDSEMVYGPAYVHFDLAGFVTQRGGG